MKNKKVWISILVAAAFVFGAFYWWPKEQNQKEKSRPTVQVGADSTKKKNPSSVAPKSAEDSLWIFIRQIDKKINWLTKKKKDLEHGNDSLFVAIVALQKKLAALTENANIAENTAMVRHVDSLTARLNNLPWQYPLVDF